MKLGESKYDRQTQERRVTRFRIPKRFVKLLDAENAPNGLTWRKMPGGKPDIKAMNWWLYKRGLLDLNTERTAQRAVRDLEANELMEEAA